jgi:UDP-N-acetylmuramoyl-L-alanyl-D-glutamate--2,6-diaminopimelate ligase
MRRRKKWQVTNQKEQELMMSKPLTESIIKVLQGFAINCPEHSKLASELANFSGDLVNDSRIVTLGDIFCAIVGHAQDGRRFITKAIAQGAKLVLAECEYAEQHGEVSSIDNVSIISFYQLNFQLFTLSKAYYQNPQASMTMIGITGTNGKTTTSQLIAQMLTADNKPCAVIGTNGAGKVNQLKAIENTTPSASELHQLFYQFQHEQQSHVAMEVSSHALVQGRVSGDLFDIAVFTNLSRDHLDYHGTMIDYANAKKALFTGSNRQTTVLNFDDEQVQCWLLADANTDVFAKNNWLYGQSEALLSAEKFVCAKDIKHHHQGVTFTLTSHLGEVFINSPLLGDFNIENLLAAISVLLVQGVELNVVAQLAKQVTAVAGRMEATTGIDLPTAVVDYAHTPDALEKALQACRQHCQGELYVVFGCGGDRDKGKRPLMAKAAQEYADHIVITNDNPRSENAEQIAEDIVAGFTYKKANKVNEDSHSKVTINLAREQAVLTTLAKASAQDIVLLAGKGHEDYVIFPDGKGGTQKVAYDERSVVSKFYQVNSEHTL